MGGRTLAKQPRTNVQPVLVGLSVGLLIGVIVLDLLIPTGVVTRVLYVSFVMLSLASDRRVLPFLAALGFTGLIAYELYSSYTTLEHIPLPVIAATSLLFLAVWVPVAAYLSAKQVEAYDELMSTPVHVCPSCQKVRDDKGLWSKIEDFLKMEMGREAAKGVCPTCLNKWTASRAQTYS